MPKSRKRKNAKRKKLHNSNFNPQTDANYSNAKFELIQEVEPPSYDTAMEWMKDSGSRHLAFDCWARGNYTKRLIHNHNKGITPLLVPIIYADEMRWAYRRLALLGLPIEFIYCGKVPKAGLAALLCPTDIILDAGWGYTGFYSVYKTRGRDRFPVVGYARPMPETLLDWIVDEAPDDFVEGKVFVAPAEAIGINPRSVHGGLDKLAGITRGASIIPDHEIARAAIELNIPFLDNMSPAAFRKFLSDYEGELVRFQRAFRNVVTGKGKSEDQLKDYIEELRHEIAELTVSAKHSNTRRSIAKLGGVVATFTASLAMAVKAAPDSMLPVVGAAGVGAATAVLFDLWKQATEQEQSLTENPYFILWKLGLSRPSEVKRVSKANLAEVPKLPHAKLEANRAYHWLCPPTVGLRFVVPEAVMKELSRQNDADVETQHNNSFNRTRN